MKARTRRASAAVLATGLLTVLSACSSDASDKDTSDKKTISATTRPELPDGLTQSDLERDTQYYNDPNKIVDVVTFADGTGSFSVSVNYQGQALRVDIKPTAKTTGTVTGATLVSPGNNRSWCTTDVSPCIYRKPFTWNSFVSQDITGTSTVYNPYTTAGLLSKGVTKTDEGVTFLLEHDTFTARIFLNGQGDMTGLHLLETDKDFHLKINRRPTEEQVDCTGSYCQVWNKAGTKSTRIGKCYKDMDCRFDKPLAWSSLHGSDAAGVDKQLFTKASLGLNN